jgi:hypothetical protein
MANFQFASRHRTRNTYLDLMKRQPPVTSNAAQHACKIGNEAFFTAVDRWTGVIHRASSAVSAIACLSKITTTGCANQFIQVSRAVEFFPDDMRSPLYAGMRKNLMKSTKETYRYFTFRPPLMGDGRVDILHDRRIQSFIIPSLI